MRKHTYKFSLDPGLYESHTLDNIKKRLLRCSIDSHFEDLSGERFNAANEDIHKVNTFYLTNGDVIRFYRMNNEAFDLLQLDFVTMSREIPKYLGNILSDLKCPADAYAGGNEMVQEVDDIF